jgi:MFS family permease
LRFHRVWFDGLIIFTRLFAGVNEAATFVFYLMIFAAGYVIQPLGVLFFGSIGDRTGRKIAFLITISMMGIAIFVIGLQPTYETVGIWRW